MQTSSVAPVRRKKRDFRHGMASLRLALFHAVKPVGMAACMFLLTFVRWFQIPSPFAAAFLLAFEGASPFLLMGIGASAAIRLLWGLPLDAWQLAACGALWLVKKARTPKPGVETAIWGGVAMLPRIVAALVSGTPQDVLYSIAAAPLAMLAAFCFRSGMDAAMEMGTVSRGREQASLLWLCLLAVDGLGYFRMGPFSLGQSAAVALTFAFALFNGPVYGLAGGLVSGLSLALVGLDCRIVLPLALCGLAGGLPPLSRFRWVGLPTAVAAALLAGFVSGMSNGPLSLWSAALGAAVFCLIPVRVLERAKPYLAGMEAPQKNMETAFVQSRIEHMRDAVLRLAKALPAQEQAPASPGEELGQMLCGQCVNREMCWGRSRIRTEKMMDCMMDLTVRGEEISESLVPSLAEHGCLRSEVIGEVAQDAQLAFQKHTAAAQKAHYQRDVTLTHLAALSGTLEELDALAQGGSFHDLRSAHAITLALEELQVPARLLYARRVDGHLQTALEAENLLPIQRPLENLLAYLAKEEGMRLSVTQTVKNTIELEEVPVYAAQIGTANLCAGENGDSGGVCGDAMCTKRCEGGRLLTMLCDGMGHGEKAHLQSEKTIELLLLLLEAGYTRRQAITAVNGILLGAQQEEQFSTVDLADVDLWTGDVYAEKLGASPSWVVRGSHMKKIEGASLPLGILEEATPTAVQYRLHSGDILVMMSDGVTDAFESEEQLRKALEDNLYVQPQRMADALLRSALLCSGGVPKDDMSVLVLLIMDHRQSGDWETTA